MPPSIDARECFESKVDLPLSTVALLDVGLCAWQGILIFISRFPMARSPPNHTTTSFKTASSHDPSFPICWLSAPCDTASGVALYENSGDRQWGWWNINTQSFLR